MTDTILPYHGGAQWTMGADEAHSLGVYLYWSGWPKDQVYHDGELLIRIAHAAQPCPEPGRCPIEVNDD